MFYILEEEDKLDRLEKLVRLGCYVDIISSNNNYHPKLASLVAVYIRLVGSKNGYIIPIDHSEGINVDKERVSTILSKANTLYTLNKKDLLYYFNLQAATDLSLLYSMVEYERLEYVQETNKINYFYNKHRNFSDVNKIIPLSLLYDNCENIFKQVERVIEYQIPSGFDFYNTTATNVFYLLEQPGLGIYYDAFNQLFTPKDPTFSIKDNNVYTSYNLYNATSRPTNAFNSVNYAAIPKSAEHRRCFKPQGDYFVEFDFDGYHLRLLSEQIDYALTEESAHKQLAKLYFEKEEITDEEYNQAKQINFHALYGKIPEKYAFLEIFEKIQAYINSLWDKYEKTGVINNPISDKPFTNKLKDMNPQKLMNYMMQSLETSRNIEVLKNVLRYLKNKRSNVVLYTYDALLFDFFKEDGKETLDDIERILSENGKYPVRFKYSQNLVL